MALTLRVFPVVVALRVIPLAMTMRVILLAITSIVIRLAMRLRVIAQLKLCECINLALTNVNVFYSLPLPYIPFLILEA
jgi:hypothetical protein